MVFGLSKNILKRLVKSESEVFGKFQYGTSSLAVDVAYISTFDVSTHRHFATRRPQKTGKGEVAKT